MMEDATQTELEAAAFRALVHHLMLKRPDVQNIDLMNLGGFCRNCLSRWYQEAAAERGIEMTKIRRARWSTGCPTRIGLRRTSRPRRMRASRRRSRKHLRKTWARRTDGKDVIGVA